MWQENKKKIALITKYRQYYGQEVCQIQINSFQINKQDKDLNEIINQFIYASQAKTENLEQHIPKTCFAYQQKIDQDGAFLLTRIQQLKILVSEIQKIVQEQYILLNYIQRCKTYQLEILMSQIDGTVCTTSLLGARKIIADVFDQINSRINDLNAEIANTLNYQNIVFTDVQRMRQKLNEIESKRQNKEMNPYEQSQYEKIMLDITLYAPPGVSISFVRNTVIWLEEIISNLAASQTIARIFVSQLQRAKGFSIDFIQNVVQKFQQLIIKTEMDSGNTFLNRIFKIQSQYIFPSLDYILKVLDQNGTNSGFDWNKF